MNRKNRESLIYRAKALASSAKARAVGMVGTVSMLPSLAFAQEATFDPATITTKIATYAGFAVVIILAMAAAVWGMRAAGIIKK
ncbi:hypothetical protein TB9_21960 [Xanthomonas perforans]|uniref:Uncharacterized protein n=1 Tax=Xanthomonas perforans TaxID=442694 RepID=A0ABR5EMN0_XANPE|nr:MULTISPECIES: hypothetical protein [Xanthomonas]KLC02423.1 hypothetical protein XP315_19780 [Xanthomonas perforans]KLC14582.1 hypothetical protein XP56_19755 [Xanthomonas perforans]KLC18739.1 hypothetical protein XP816_21275 [Xanthomonas perforans]KLC24137.1 hypothetical protein XP712_02255 [Xanthomonas perforans]KLC28156.1 hypothetical protein XP95_18900 [Xanthomonas perforans]